MKKLSILLVFLLLLGVFAGCYKNNSDDSETSADESDISTDPVSTISYSTVVSVGKSYEKSIEADPSYEDSYGIELTDGIYAEGDTISYSDSRLSGYNSDLKVVIDLENDGQRLYRFEISYLSTTEAGIAPMASGSVFISDDNESWTKIGDVVKPDYIDKVTQTAFLELEAPVDARYVRFNITKASAWVFLDEMTVIADIQGTSAEMEYLSMLNEAYANDDMTNEQRLALISSVLGDEIDRTKTRAPITIDCNYSTSYSSSADNHKDDGKKLTDGNVTGAAFERDVWVGFEGGKELDITITLEEERSDLAAFELSMYNRSSTGITLPVYVDISVSADNQDFILIGRVYAATDINQRNYTYSLNLPRAVKGKYIRFTLAETESSLFLIEEAAAFAYIDYDLGGNALYPQVVLPEVKEKTFWSSGEADYSKNINLIRGLSYQISSGVRLEAKEAAPYNDPVTSPLLTDGVKSSNTYYNNGQWFRTHRGGSRSIYFDLTHTSAITGYSVNFLKYGSAGISLPGSFSLHLSEDGIHWFLAKTSPVPDPDGVIAISTIEMSLDNPVQARFARFSFDVGVHVFLDEIELFGTKQVGSSAITPQQLGVREEITGEMLAPSEDILGGVRDVLLAYHNSASSVLTQEVFRSYVGYTNTKGEIKDTMFDGYLFLPSTGALPSGGRPFAGSVKRDWDYLLDNVFTENRNIDALNKAVDEVKEALDMPDYKVKVYYTILYPSQSVTSFGDVDGDGVNEDFSKLEDRLKAIEWYMDEFLSRFEQGNYENLEFCGFYWFHETINHEEDDLNTLRGVSELVRDRNSQFFWIPYFTASGYYQWSMYGFDAVCLQPNYAFREDATKYRIATAADLIKQYNMCIEIEINSAALSDDLYYERYMDYLKGGVYYGYMTGSIHMYYQGVMDIYYASQSDDRKTRLIYDYTYEFIKGTLSIYPDKLNDISIEVEKDNIYEGRLFEPNNINRAMISLSAQNGTVTVNADGSFRYYPNKGFTGTDTFTFKLSEGLDWSEDTLVTITVG